MKKAEKIITHDDICTLLETKHSGDVCVSECNVGSSTQDRDCQRIDFWAMKKSYTHPTVWAYEIKTNRSDWLHDGKWRGYLKYCTDFYFIAPPGIIEIEEVPSDAGLLVCSKNARRIYTKRKAPHRSYVDVDIPDKIYRYILFSRATIDVPPTGNTSESRLDHYKALLDEKEERYTVGRSLAHKISQLVNKKVGDVRSENANLHREISELESFREWLNALGLGEDDLADCTTVWQLQAKLRRSVDVLAKSRDKIRVSMRALKSAAEVLQIEIDNEGSGRTG